MLYLLLTNYKIKKIGKCKKNNNDLFVHNKQYKLLEIFFNTSLYNYLDYNILYITF